MINFNQTFLQEPKQAPSTEAGACSFSPDLTGLLNYNTFFAESQVYGSETLFKFAVSFLQEKLKDFYLHFEREGEFLTMLAQKRGNQIYQQLFLRPRFLELKKGLKRVLKVEKRKNGLGLTNTIFTTLTIDSKFTLQESWLLGKHLSQFINGLRKIFGKIEYIKVIEAHTSGRLHIHLIIVLPFEIEFRLGAERRGYILRQEIYQDLKNKISRLWKYGFVDLQAVSSFREALSYLTKYIFKSSEIETTLEKIKRGELLKEGEVKKIWLHFFSRIYHLRFFTASNFDRERLDKRLNNNSPSQGSWQRVSQSIWLLKYREIIEVFDKIWLIRASPGQLRISGLDNQQKFLMWLDLDQGLRLKIMLQSLRELFLGKQTQDIPFKFQRLTTSPGLWLSGVFHKLNLN